VILLVNLKFVIGGTTIFKICIIPSKIMVPEKNVFYKCSLLQDSFINDCVTVKEVTDDIMGQKKSKAAGPKGLGMETFIYGGTKIWIHLSLLYTFCIKHCFLPAHFMDINIIPVIKIKVMIKLTLIISVPLRCQMLTLKSWRN